VAALVRPVVVGLAVVTTPPLPVEPVGCDANVSKLSVAPPPRVSVWHTPLVNGWLSIWVWQAKPEYTVRLLWVTMTDSWTVEGKFGTIVDNRTQAPALY